MKEKYTSVFDLEGKQLKKFMDKYGDIFEPRLVDLEYYKLYYLGKYDPMIRLFDYLNHTFDIKSVYYPGSFIHLSPSFAFDNVTYVDHFPNIGSFFEDEEILKYLNLHKLYQSPSKLTYLDVSYLRMSGQFDLMISSNAGSVSIDCFNCLAPNGYLLVNNGHSDADNAFANNRYEYLGYFKFDQNMMHVTFCIDGTSNKSDTYYLFKKLA